MAGRHALLILTTSALVSALVPACSKTARHRVLRFFFGGAPEPGKPAEAAPGTPGATGPREIAGAPAERLAGRRMLYVHPPYREKEGCRAYHDPSSAQLLMTVREGLCMSCHVDPADAAPYVHGPVAVNDCVACHHYHGSPYPKMLLEDARAICFRCHERSDLGDGPQHAMIDDQGCLECHDPHGGHDRFLLKRSER